MASATMDACMHELPGCCGEPRDQQAAAAHGCWVFASACPLELNRDTKASVGGCKQQARPAAFQGPKGKGSEGPRARVGETGRPAGGDRRQLRSTPVAARYSNPSRNLPGRAFLSAVGRGDALSSP